MLRDRISTVIYHQSRCFEIAKVACDVQWSVRITILLVQGFLDETLDLLFELLHNAVKLILIKKMLEFFYEKGRFPRVEWCPALFAIQGTYLEESPQESIILGFIINTNIE